MQYDKVLMLYFPSKKKEEKTPTPTPTGRSSASGTEEDFDDDYTPFLIEMDPKEQKVKIYYKKPLIEPEENDWLIKKCKFYFLPI